MKDYVFSLIRTDVPVGVGTVLGWLAILGVDVNASAQDSALSLR